MLKNYYLYACMGVLCSLLLWSCFKDDDDGPSESPTTPILSVEEAREFFDGFITEFEIVPFTTGESTSDNNPEIPNITPLWANGKSFEFAGQNIVEVPFNTIAGTIMPREDPDQPLSVSLKTQNTINRLIAVKTSESEILYNVIAITADAQYLKGRKKARLERLSLSNIGSFSGTIRFYDLAGHLTGGVIYKDGKQTGIVKALEAEEQGVVQSDVYQLLCVAPAKSRAGHYEQYCEPHLMQIEHCTYTKVLEDDGSLLTTHVQCYYTYQWESVCDMVWVEDYVPPGGGGSTEGGGTGSGGTGGHPVTPTPQIVAPLATKIFKSTSNLTIAEWKELEKMIQKILNDCMASKLFNSRQGKEINIVHDPTADDSFYNVSENKISLKNLYNYGVLTQELMHHYQRENTTDNVWNTTTANLEVEGHLAQYLVLKRGGIRVDKYYKEGFGEKIKNISCYIDNKANITPSSSKFFYTGYKEAMSIYKSELPKTTMSTSQSDMNLNRLKELSNDC